MVFSLHLEKKVVRFLRQDFVKSFSEDFSKMRVKIL